MLTRLAGARAGKALILSLLSLLFAYDAQGAEPAIHVSADYVARPAAKATGRATPAAKRSAAAVRTRPTRVAARRRAASRAKARRAAAVRKLTKKQRVGFRWPVRGPISSRFGTRHIGDALELHRGMDIVCRKGTPIRAAMGGRVVLAGKIPIYGYTVALRHPRGYSTLYSHMTRLHVRNGARVKPRQTIGRCGSTGRSTGPHLHFEIRRSGRHLNPRPFLR